jgi:hypothetical protein
MTTPLEALRPADAVERRPFDVQRGAGEALAADGEPLVADGTDDVGHDGHLGPGRGI